MRPRKVLERIRAGSKNIRFADFVGLVEAYGFVETRRRGSHRMYWYEGVEDLVNLQPDRNGQAKQYQVHQFMSLVERHRLRIEEQE